MEQNRLLSPIVWAAVAAQVLAILVTLNVIDTGLSDSINSLVSSVLQLLVSFGILNNPTSKNTF